LEEYEIDLRQLFLKLWKGKYIILAVFSLAVLLAALYSFVILDPIFESRAILRLNPLPSQIQREFTLDKIQTDQGYFPLTEKINVEIVNFSRHGYSLFFSHQRVISNLQSKLQNELGRDISANRLIKSIKREIDAENSFLHLTFQDNDPDHAQEILNAWIEVFKKEVFDQLVRENYSNLEQKELQKERAYNHYSDLSQSRVDFFNEFPVDQMKTRLSELEKDYSIYLNELQKAKIDLTYYQETIKIIESLVEEEEDNLDQIILALGEELQEQFFQNLKQLALELQEVSPVMVFLRQQGIEHRVQLEGLGKRISGLETLLREIDQEISVLRSDIRKLEKEEKHLGRQYESAWKNMLRTEEEYFALSFFLENLSNPGVTVFEEPTLRTGRVGPNHRLNLALAGVLGLFLGTGGLLFYNFMRGD